VSGFIPYSRRLLATALILGTLGGCAGSVRQAAKAAAPAAVESAIDETQDPNTRNDIARILGDPAIRAAASELSSAVLEGALLGLTEEEQQARLAQVVDRMVSRFGTSFARSLQRDIGPMLSATLADAVDASLERALDAHAEERLQALAAAVTRGAMQAFESSSTEAAGSRAGATTLGPLAREISRQAAFGFQDAVRETQTRDRAARGEGAVLAAMGQLSDVALALPLLLLVGVPLALGALGLALVWALFRLRAQRRQSHEREAAALVLARAIKGTENLAWSDELREHLDRVTRDADGGESLRQLLREHAELRLAPRHNGEYSS
jgi:hypothetical protein